jgi:hypothetical protein
MIGPIVLLPQNSVTHRSETPLLQLGLGSSQHVDPLSEVLALMKPQLYVAGGFAVLGDMAIQFPKTLGNQVLRHARRTVLVGRRRRCPSRCSTLGTAFCSRVDFRSGSPPTSRSNRFSLPRPAPGSA